MSRPNFGSVLFGEVKFQKFRAFFHLLITEVSEIIALDGASYFPPTKHYWSHTGCAKSRFLLGKLI